MVSSSLMATDCTSDYIELNTQAGIDSFQSAYGGGGTCDTVPGTLRIGGLDVVDLTPLSALTTIRDQFQIRQTHNLIDLDGLSALTSVGGDQNNAAGSFYIFDNAALTNFIGLSGLASVGGTLYISNNPVLTSVDGMSSLTSVHGLGIGANDSLTDLSGISALVSGSVSWSLGIGGNGALTNLDVLSALTSVGGLSITHNYALANLDGLAALTNVDRNLVVRGNNSLTNLKGLSALTSVGFYGKFQIIANAALTNVDALSGLASVGQFNIFDNAALTNLNGLSALTSARSLGIIDNAALTNLNGLSALNRVDWSLTIEGNPLLTNLDDLSGLTSVGRIYIIDNAALTNLNGLSALNRVDWSLTIEGNPLLTNLDGLPTLTSLEDLSIVGNNSLTNLDSLSTLTSVGNVMAIQYNKLLGQCVGLARLVDQWDDAEPGPGPGVGGVPDVGGKALLGDNLTGCNSIQEILATDNPSRINPGLNDAWYDPETDGQGFFITVFPDLGAVSLAWFTYDTQLPAEDATANLGDPGHRWLTAVGPIQGNQAVMEIEMTSGGLFDSDTPVDRTDPPGSDGSIILTFTSCNSATVEYDITSIDQQGIVPIQRVANDNIVICEALSTD